MKVCIVVPSLSGGGAEFVAREWAKWLTRSGDNVTLAITHPKVADIHPEGAAVVHLVGSGPVEHVKAMQELVRKNRFDAVIGLLPYFNLLAILGCLSFRWRSRPKVFISGRNVEVPFPDVHGKNVFITRLLSKALYPLADGYIAISHPVAAEAGALYRIKPSKMRVVPNPATAKVQAWRGNSSDRIDSLGVAAGSADDATLNVIVPARLVDQKRPFIAVEAVRILQNNNKNQSKKITLHFFGDGPLRAAVEEAVQNAGVDAKFHGWVEEWFSSSPRSGVVLLTSLAEGFGNVLVEAAAIGLPSVVSSRCLGSADAVVPGITGEFAAGDSAVDYAAAISKAAALTLDSKQIAEWLNRFSAESSGTALRQYLNSVVLEDAPQ